MNLKDIWLKVKVGDSNEIDVNTITPDLHFIELTTQPAFTNSYQNIIGINGILYTS